MLSAGSQRPQVAKFSLPQSLQMLSQKDPYLEQMEPLWSGNKEMYMINQA